MKKILFALPVILLLAAGCNSSPQTSTQTQTSVAQNQTPNPTPSPTSTVTPATTTTADGWLTCDNTLGHFEYSYPANWILAIGGTQPIKVSCGHQGNGATITTDISNITVPQDQSQAHPTVNTIHVSIFNPYNHYNSSDDYFNNDKDIPWQSKPFKTTTMDGEKVYWTQPSLPNTYELYAWHNQIVYDIVFYSVDSSIQDKFLSQFKFLP